jgi:hypothetical protein
MNTFLIILVTLAAVALGLLVGWFASLRFSRPAAPPALSPADVEHLRDAFKGLFSQFINNTTYVVSGLQEDLHGLRSVIEGISAWEPGQELENAAQLTRFMNQSSNDRAKLHREIRSLRRFLIALTPMIVVIFLRIVYVVFWGAS